MVFFALWFTYQISIRLWCSEDLKLVFLPYLRLMKDKLLGYISNITALDKRSLSLFRCFLAIFIVADIWVRAQDLQLFYTDAGVVKAEDITYGWVSIYTWFDSTEWVVFLFFMTVALALVLLNGGHSRWVLLILFYLTLSLHIKNYLVINAGDQWFKWILLLSAFLPLDHYRWIGKSTKQSKAQLLFSSPWTFLFLLQIVLVYSIAGFSKRNDVWTSGIAVQYIMQVHVYAKSTASWLLEYPSIMKGLNYFTLMLEKFGWLLFFIPVKKGYVRMGLVSVFIAFHLGLFLFLELGMFPWLALVVWSAVLPSGFWEFFFKKEKSIKSSTLELKHESPITIGLSAFVFCLMIYALVMNAKSFSGIKPVSKVIKSIRLTQRWGLFAKPAKADGWMVINAYLNGGDSIDLARPNQQLTWERPVVCSAEFDNHRQRKFAKNIRSISYIKSRSRYVKYLCDQWDAQQKDSSRYVKTVEMHYMQESIADTIGYLKVLPIKKKIMTDILASKLN